ncbi:MAG: A/G-specific adenine glycosylase [Acidimicrobiia bacterium]
MRIDQGALLAWWSRRRRDLPWRATRDPWAILVSETMLQQTQVARVLPKFLAFMEEFPTAQVCAAADPGDVVRAWAGLGYNRRAIALHRAAATVVDQFGGAFPATVDELRTLPGVGPYTARAVCAFAHELDVAVVDTNVARVLARTAGHRLTAKEVQARADALVPEGEGWAWNQAMLDLGATVCQARTPSCKECPVAEACSWRGASDRVDPAIGSAGVSGGQSRFEGSDRQGRGRLVSALRHAPVGVADLATVMGWPDDPPRAERVATTLVADRVVRFDEGVYRL